MRRWIVFVLCLVVIGVFAKPDFSSFNSTAARNQAFIAYILEQSTVVNQQIMQTRAKIDSLQQQKQLSATDQRWLQQLAADYRLTNFNPNNKKDWTQLLKRVDVIPNSLVLAQAANESGWGTSRFARQGSNYFGLWCRRQGCGMVPRRRADTATHEVRTFDDAFASTQAYIHFLNTNPAFVKLRQLRQNMRIQDNAIVGDELAQGLTPYSALGNQYVQIIRAMMTSYEFKKYDS